MLTNFSKKHYITVFDGNFSYRYNAACAPGEMFYVLRGSSWMLHNPYAVLPRFVLYREAFYQQ